MASPMPSSTRQSSAAGKAWTNAKPNWASVSRVSPTPSIRLLP